MSVNSENFEIEIHSIAYKLTPLTQTMQWFVLNLSFFKFYAPAVVACLRMRQLFMKLKR